MIYLKEVNTSMDILYPKNTMEIYDVFTGYTLTFTDTASNKTVVKEEVMENASEIGYLSDYFQFKMDMTFLTEGEWRYEIAYNGEKLASGLLIYRKPTTIGVNEEYKPTNEIKYYTMD